jgi:hypothetical protein
MKPCWVALALLVFVFSPALAEDIEPYFKEAVKLTHEVTDLLKTVKDKASAEAASAKMKAFDEQIAVLKKKEAEFAESSPKELQRLRTKYQTEFETAFKALGTELDRIEKLPEAKAQLVKESAFIKRAYETVAQLDEAQIRFARVQIEKIETAVVAYKVKTGAYPKTLDELTTGKEPYLEKEDLSDPWKKAYKYDPDGPKHKGTKPDVWTVAPNKKVIGNWEEEKK